MPGVITNATHPRTCGARRLQHGAATLVVVLLLFFVIALVSAYTSRNLIFEQRTSVNQYRATMAFETADAGIEWALALLNGGRIGNDCTEATAVAGSTSFRQRYLVIDPTDGKVIARRPVTDPTRPLIAMCVWTGANWACNCPEDGDPVLAEPPGGALHPAFAVHFTPDPEPPLPLRVNGALPRPGVVRIEVNGCVRMAAGCLLDFSDRPQQSEGRAQHSVLVALKPAVTTLPVAALTVFGNLEGGGGGATVKNSNAAAGGITIQAAGAVDPAKFSLLSAPGTPGELSVVASDSSLVPDGLTLADLLAVPAVPSNWDRVFGSVFGLLPQTYREQPAARVLNCPAAGCRAALSALAAANPDRVIWIPGDLVLESAGDVGSLPDPANAAVAGPATIVVDGNVSLAAGVNIYGIVYSRSGNWTGPGTITGAAIVEGTLRGASAPSVQYDQSVINATRLSSGSFVPMQGDWRDFK